MESLSIGEFARACGLSVPALRRYADHGVLRPAGVDPWSRYRRFTFEQVDDGVLVRLLRQLDVPVSLVARIVAADDRRTRLALLDEHWNGVEDHVARNRQLRDHLVRVLEGRRDLERRFPVRVVAVPEVHVLVRRRLVTAWQVPSLVRESLDLLTARAGSSAACGEACVLYYDVVDDGQSAEVEVCLPVPGGGDAVLPAGCYARADVLGDEGRYPRVLAAWGAVAQWTFRRGLQRTGPFRQSLVGLGHVHVGWLVREHAEVDQDDAGPSPFDPCLR